MSGDKAGGPPGTARDGAGAVPGASPGEAPAEPSAAPDGPAGGTAGEVQIPLPFPVAVIGASGRSGQVLCRALLERGARVVPVVRDVARWRDAAISGAEAPRIADLRDGEALRRALHGVGAVASCAHARFAEAIIEATAPEVRLVLLGSTRRFSRWADRHGDGVRAGEAALLRSGRDGVMLHPTMIYGAQGEDNVQRLAALMRRLPVAPLPGGGHALVQPIHQDDVVDSVIAALRRRWERPETVVIAGAEAVRYRDFLGAVCRAAGVRVPPVVPVPLWPLVLAAPLTRLVPRVPVVRAAELRRLTEDKGFGIERMQAALGIVPRPLAEGLRQTFSR